MDAQLRAQIRQRAENRCEYCRLPDAVQLLPFHVEHIVAKQHGGGDDEHNLAWACDRCNAYKGPNIASIDPETAMVTNLFHPRRDAWQSHFTIRDAEIMGVSAVGRATARLLQLNARHRVELRRELIEQELFD
jgi:HNH endonuclease